MSKPKKCKVKGKCLCNCSKALNTTNAGDNYDCMPTKIARLDDNYFRVIESQYDYFAHNLPTFCGPVYTDGSPLPDYVIGNSDAPSKGGSNTFMWSKVVSKVHNILNLIDNNYSNFCISSPFSNLKFPQNTLNWREMLNGNFIANSNSNPDDFRSIKSDVTIRNGKCDNINIFIPIYAEGPFLNLERNKTQIPEYVEIGRAFPNADDLGAALPDLYKEYRKERDAVGNEWNNVEDWVTSITGMVATCPEYCLTDNGIVISSVLCGFSHYTGGSDCGITTFSWWLNWKYGKSAYPPPPMDVWISGNDTSSILLSDSDVAYYTANGVPSFDSDGTPITVPLDPKNSPIFNGPYGFITACGWKKLPHFLCYTYELLLNNKLDLTRPTYISKENIPDTSFYGYMIDITSPVDLDHTTFDSARKVKITRKTKQHIVTVEDKRDVKWIAGINYCSSDAFPGMGSNLYGDSICDLDRTNYKLCDDQTDGLYKPKYAELMEFDKVKFIVDGKQYSIPPGITCGLDGAYGGVTGGAFKTFEWSVEDTNFYEDVTKITDDGEVLYVPDIILNKVIGQVDAYDIYRTTVSIYRPLLIYDVTSDFSMSDMYTDYTGVTSGWGEGDFDFRAEIGEHSTYDHTASYDIITGTENFPYRKPMVGPVKRAGNSFFIDGTTLQMVGCTYVKPDVKYISVCTGGGGTTELHGWMGMDGTLLYCPYNNVTCDGFVDMTNIEEGRAADDLVFSDKNLTEVTVSKIPQYKILRDGKKLILLSDFQDPTNKDLYDFSLIDGTYCTGGIIGGDEIYQLSSVEDIIGITPSTFPTASDFYSDMNTFLLDFQPEYFSKDDGLSDVGKHFLTLNYMKKGPLIYQYIDKNDGIPNSTPEIILFGSAQKVGRHKRDFFGVEKTKCNDSNFWVENVRGFTLGGKWFDDVYSVSILFNDSYNIDIVELFPFKRMIKTGDYSWESINNVIRMPSHYNLEATERTDIYFLVDIYFDISVDDNIATLTVNNVYSNDTNSYTITDFCEASADGFKFIIDFPAATRNYISSDIFIQNFPMTFKVTPQNVPQVFNTTSDSLISNIRLLSQTGE